MKKIKVTIAISVIILALIISYYCFLKIIKQSDYTLQVTDFNRNELLTLLKGDNVKVKEDEILTEIQLKFGIPDREHYDLYYLSGESSTYLTDSYENSPLVQYIVKNGTTPKKLDYIFIFNFIIILICICYLSKIIIKSIMEKKYE